MATTFNGVLQSNVVYDGTYNAYQLIYTVGDQLAGLKNSVAEQFREDAGSYSTDKVYTDFDILKSYKFDENETNVLAKGQQVVPKQEKIRITESRQISLYTPTLFLTKIAWMNEGAWTEFNSVVQKNLTDTKRAYDYLMGQVAIGTLVADTSTHGAGQATTITLPAHSAGETADIREAVNRLRGQTLAKGIDDLMVAVCDLGRDYNSYGFMKSFNREDFVVVYNTNVLNSILNIDLPTIYHKDGLGDYKGDKMQAKWFGTKNSAIILKANITANTYRAVDEGDWTTAATLVAADSSNTTHCYPGDYVPANSAKIIEASNDTHQDIARSLSTGAPIGEVYTNDASIFCKIIHKDAIKYLTGYETESEFWNGRNLSTNRYLTWFFSKPDKLSSYPLITVKIADEEADEEDGEEIVEA